MLVNNNNTEEERKALVLNKEKFKILKNVKVILNYMERGLHVNSQKIETLRNQFTDGINSSLTIEDLRKYYVDNHLSGGDMCMFIKKHIEE